MSDKDTGGAAFPMQHTVADANDPFFKLGQKGMTLRDYFAAKAMQGILAYPGDEIRGSAHNNSTPDEVALSAYRYADAMLHARGEA
jgi:hypothetical protein